MRGISGVFGTWAALRCFFSSPSQPIITRLITCIGCNFLHLLSFLFNEYFISARQLPRRPTFGMIQVITAVRRPTSSSLYSPALAGTAEVAAIQMLPSVSFILSGNEHASQLSSTFFSFYPFLLHCRAFSP